MKQLLLTFSLLFCMTANAAYIVESSPGVVTAIGNLDIGGTLYNVDFEAADNAFSTFGGNELFWPDQASASAAILAANAILQNAVGGPKGQLNNLSNIHSNLHSYIVWGGGPFMNKLSVFAGGWFLPNVAGGDYALLGGALGTAWSVSAVPLPASSWLFLSAWAGLMGRKKLARN